MSNAVRVAAIVPAKGRSARVPGKNLRPLAGRPLVTHILATLQQCRFVDEVYLDSDCETVLALGRDLGVRTITRPHSLAADTANGNDLLIFEAGLVRADIYIQTFATNPLLRPETIDAAVLKLMASPRHDSLFAVFREHSYFWSGDGIPVNYDPKRLPRSQDLPAFYRETTGLYIIRREALLSRGCRIGAKPMLFEVDAIEATDINYEYDLQVAQVLMEREREHQDAPAELLHA